MGTGSNLDARRPCDCAIALARLDERIKAIWDNFHAEEKVRDGVKESLDQKLETMNEFRSQINKAEAKYVTWGALFAVSLGIATLVGIGIQVIVSLVRH